MNIIEIISDALEYPLHNIPSLILFLILGIIAAIIGGSTAVSIIVGLKSTGLAGGAFTGMGVIGLIVFIIILFLVEGYALDIIKYGIERRTDSPGIDIGRQIANAIKLVVVSIVYYIIPVIIIFVLSLILKTWLIAVIAIILFIVFALAHFMAKCRLAKTDDLGAALAIGEAIGDISRVGFAKIIILVLIVAVILMLIAIVVALFSKINSTLGSIILGIASVYFSFFYNRAIGLLYSD